MWCRVWFCSLTRSAVYILYLWNWKCTGMYVCVPPQHHVTDSVGRGCPVPYPVYSPMTALAVVSSVKFIPEAHQKIQISMNTIVSVVVGFCLFLEVFGDASNNVYCPCTCGPVNSSTLYKCPSKRLFTQYEDQYIDIFEKQQVCNSCTQCTNRNTYNFMQDTPNPETYYYPLYIFLDSLLVLILVPVVLFFNINLASGLGHSLVFMYQVLVALYHIGTYNQYTDGCNMGNFGVLLVSGLPVLFNAPLQLWWPSQTLTHYSYGYVKILIAGVLVVVSFFLATCTQCPLQCCRSPWAKLRRAVRNWRERLLPQRSVLTGVCSVAILMYGSLVEVSFRLLFRCELVDYICHYTQYSPFDDSNNEKTTFCCRHDHTASSQTLCWNRDLPYFIPAYIFIGVAVLLSLPFFYRPGVPVLVSYLTRGRVQLPRLHKLAPLFDVFQGVYKPKMQFFAGLYLLYRIALWSVAAFASNDYKNTTFLSLSIVILAIHSLFQPFESRRHNYAETLLMVNVALITVVLGNYSRLFNYNTQIALTTLSFSMDIVLTSLPLLCVFAYYIYKIIRLYYHCYKRSVYQEIQPQGEGGEDEDNLQGERWEPPQNEVLN